jgi:hypothetical protein
VQPKYGKGLETLRAAWDHRNTVADLTITFQVATAQFRYSCEVLLEGLPLASDDYAALFEETGGSAWTRADIRDQLQLRLGNDCSMYTKIVHRIHRGLLKFATKLGLDPTNNMRV